MFGQQNTIVKINQIPFTRFIQNKKELDTYHVLDGHHLFKILTQSILSIHFFNCVVIFLNHFCKSFVQKRFYPNTGKRNMVLSLRHYLLRLNHVITLI